uniref:Uncharacterized protein n=1 Tax=Scylla olivacea TaxID=85551 RepID=A0A0P4VQ44_SCYOL
MSPVSASLPSCSYPQSPTQPCFFQLHFPPTAMFFSFSLPHHRAPIPGLPISFRLPTFVSPAVGFPTTMPPPTVSSTTTPRYLSNPCQTDQQSCFPLPFLGSLLLAAPQNSRPLSPKCLPARLLPPALHIPTRPITLFAPRPFIPSPLQVLALLGLVALVAARPENVFDLDLDDIHQDMDISDDTTITGTYRWRSPEGDEYFVRYIADEDGYRVLESNAVPVTADGTPANGAQGAFSSEEDDDSRFD